MKTLMVLALVVLLAGCANHAWVRESNGLLSTWTYQDLAAPAPKPCTWPVWCATLEAIQPVLEALGTIKGLK